ncbi:MAG: CcdB family protein [Alphaproteobacteria bacterium]
MSRFDVYVNPEGSGWLIDIQTDLLEGLDTRVVVPLLKLDEVPPPTKRLHPVFELSGERVVMATQLMAAVPASVLAAPLTNLSAYRDEITAALDLLFLGF